MENVKFEDYYESIKPVEELYKMIRIERKKYCIQHVWESIYKAAVYLNKERCVFPLDILTADIRENLIEKGYFVSQKPDMYGNYAVSWSDDAIAMMEKIRDNKDRN